MDYKILKLFSYFHIYIMIQAMTEMTSKGLAVTYFNKWILCIIECLKSLFKIKLTALTPSLVHSAIMGVTLLRNLAYSKRKKERKSQWKKQEFQIHNIVEQGISTMKVLSYSHRCMFIKHKHYWENSVFYYIKGIGLSQLILAPSIVKTFYHA